MNRVSFILAAFLTACGGTAPAANRPSGTSGCSVPNQLKTAVSGAAQAAVISLSGVNPTTCPEIAMNGSWANGKMIFSDSPEHPDSSGKVYEDATLAATSGTDTNRIFVYHTNGLSSGRMKWTILIKNNGTNTATLTVQHSGTAGPTTSYLYAGKIAFQRWLQSTAASPVQIAAGATVRLDSTFDSTTTAATYLMHGIWDYQMTEAHTVTVCALNETDDPLAVCPGLALLPRDTHQRGTCPNADRVYDMASAIDTANDIQQFPLAGNTANDPNAQCTDVTDGSAQELKGNFGVLYRMHYNIATSNNKKFGFLLNPRGGAWGGALWTPAGVTPGGKFLIPDSTGSLGDSTKGAVEGKYDPATVNAPWAQWMPTGGSSLPLRFVAVPY
jgi:hypothetical protein